MLSRFWLKYTACISLFLIFSHGAIAQTTQPAINTATYDIYIGDVDGDGYGGDYYFSQKPLFVLLFGDISTPLYIAGTANFAVYRNGAQYNAPQLLTLTKDQLTTKVSAGQLILAQLNSDFFIWPNSASGNNILLRGTDSSAPSALISTSASSFPPSLLASYNAATGMGNRNYPLSIVDVNGDGRSDILLGSYVSTTGQTAYLADTNGIPTRAFTVTPATSAPVASNSAVNMVGSTAGQFRVDESGAATYSVPISLPDGVAGVTPQIALGYSSQAGSGLIGKGWSLSGLSAITRCRQTLGQDGAAQPINWSSSDRFCLNGQRLILTSGSYGSANSTYKTELDSFVTVTLLSDGANLYFTSQAKDGSTSTYGRTTDSRVGYTNAILTWSINRFEDNVKNAIDFVYEGDATTGQAIRYIRYAFPSPNTAGSPISRTDYKAEVQFTNASTRTDPSSAYVGGYFFGQSKLLTSIKVLNKGSEVRTYKLSYMSSTTADSRYQNMISRLENIQECKSSYCLPPLSFTWGGGSHIAFDANANQQVNFVDTTSGKYVINNLFADVTGDGKTDLIYLMYDAYKGSPYKAQLSIHVKYAQSTTESLIGLGIVDDYTHVKISNLDYNADGRQDLALYDGTSWKIYLAAPRSDNTWKIDSSSTVIATGITDRNAIFADINSDGLADVVTNNGYQLLVRDSSQSISSNTFYKFGSWTAFTWDADSAFVGAYDTSSTYSPSYVRNCVFKRLEKSIVPTSIADFNGDGVADLMASVTRVFTCETYNFSTGGWYTGVEVTDGGNVYSYALVTSNLSATSKKLNIYSFLFKTSSVLVSDVYPQDLNGDGLTDIIYADSSNKLNYLLNKGNGFDAAVGWQQLPTYSTDPTRAKPQFLDYNGDGALDTVWVDRNSSSLNTRLWGSAQPITVTSAYGGAQDTHLLMDVSGDGILDYIKITSTNMYGYTGTMAVSGAPIPCHNVPIPVSPGYACVGGNPNPSIAVPANQQNSAMISIANGLGNVTNINYGTLSNSGRYSTTDVNLSVTQQPSNNPYCSGGTTNMYCPQLTYTVTDSSSFYSRLNGGWDLPSGSTTLVAGNATKGAPVLEVNGAMQIVTSVESSAPTAGSAPGNVSQSALSRVSYYYGEAKMQASGRGFLGFNKLKTVDEQTGVVTAMAYRQDFPFTGSPLSTIVYSDGTSTAKVLSQSSDTWDFVSFTGSDGTKYFQTKLKSATDKSFDLSSGNLLQTTTTDNQFDNFGNPTQIIVTTSGQKPNGDTTTLTKTTVNTYGSPGVADYNNIFGRLVQTTVTTVRDSDPSLARTSTFSYYGDSETGGAKGLLKTESVEPSNAAGSTTQYQYDSFGNKNKVLTTAINSSGISETRTVTTTYSADGRDLVSTVNDLNQQAQVTSRNEFGEPTNATDINSVGSQAFYDGMGREYMKKDDTGAWTRTESKYCGDGISCPAGAKFRTDKTAAGGSFAVEYFDILGRTIRTSKQGFDGRMVNVDSEYDNLSRIKRQSLPYYDGATPAGWVENTYDILGRVVKVTQPDGSYSTSSYDGYNTTITNALNQTRKETRNGLGQLVRVTDHQGGTIDYEYDIQGGLLKATTTASGNSVAVRMCYDTLGRKIAMFDPDKGGFAGNGTLTCAQATASKQPGWWYYTYDGFGELISQTDTKNQTVKMAYDKLGRMIARTDVLASGAIEGFTQWFYEKGVDGSAASVQGKLTAVVMNTDPALTTTQINNAISSGLASCSQSSVSCHKTITNFDIFGRPLDTTVYYPGSSQGYISRVSYDIFGRANKQYDAIDRVLANGTVLDSGVRTSYNDYGYAERVVDISSGELIQQTLAVNERGQVTSELRGNGVTSSNVYDNLTGQLTDQQSGIGSLFSVQNIHYKWDTIGNLKYRDNQTPYKSGGGSTKNLKESFCYDSLNRLIKTVSGTASANPDCSGTQDVTYNGLGNITSKVGVGTYSYGANAGPHAVTGTSGDGAVYTYDNNGNQIGGAGRTIAYTTYDQATAITKNGASTTFSYGPSRERWQRKDVKNGVTTVTTYLGNVERIEQLNSGYVEWKRYLGGAIYTYKTNTANQVQTNGISKSFVYNDHLGSVDVITDGAGVIRQSLSFDPWGARRNGENWGTFIASELSLNGFTQPITTRGFTGHEMVDDMGIIHMNGRIYDAKLGRFLQADPHIDGAADTQGYNRYSYVHNNPLNATDPSGFSAWTNFTSKIRPFVGAIVAIVLTVVAPWGGGFWANVAYGAIAGGAGAAANGQNILQGALMGGVSAAAFYGVGSAFQGAQGTGSAFGTNLSYTAFAEKVFAHGMVGGVMSVLQGGKFGNGFAAAGFTQAFSGAIDSIGGNSNSSAYFDAVNRGLRIAAAAVVGGTASAMSGGKFANGAMTGAFSRAFNDEAHAIARAQALKAYGELKTTLLERNANTPKGQVIELSTDEINTFFKGVYYTTLDQPRLDQLFGDSLGDTPYIAGQLSGGQADTILRDKAFSGRMFGIGGTEVEAGHLNYVGVGMLAAHYGANGYLEIPNLVIAHNVSQFWNSGGSLDWRQWNDIMPGTKWALIGADYYKRQTY